MKSENPWCKYGGKAHGPMTRSGKDWLCFACGRRFDGMGRQLWPEARDMVPTDPVTWMTEARRAGGAA